jgi:lipid-binding SYLF domain-containing protein
LGSEIRKASYSAYNLVNATWLGDRSVPLKMLADAKGLAFLTVAKAGLVFAPRFGTGLVVAKLPGGEWSAPTAIGTVGLSWGALVGADVTDYIVVLYTPEAVSAFSGLGQLTMGLGVEIAAGPVGR